MYDRQVRRGPSRQKQAYVESAMREVYLMLLSGEHPLGVAPDSELVLGHSQFKEML